MDSPAKNCCPGCNARIAFRETVCPACGARVGDPHLPAAPVSETIELSRPRSSTPGAGLLPMPDADLASSEENELDRFDNRRPEAHGPVPDSHGYSLESKAPHAVETLEGLPEGVRARIKTGQARPVQIGGYEVLAEIARGGMGVVYKARQVKLDRIVALKVLIAGDAASAEQIKRFLQEARASAKLKHPNIVPIYEVGEENGRHFFTMEFIEGQSLAGLIAGRAMNASQAVALLEPVAEAVHYAHTQGIIHRDLKPANILIDERGQPRVADFGLARDVSGGSSLSQSGHLVGTPCYMSPEQAQGQTLDPRSDVYALGVILYEMLSGKLPFEDTNLPVLLTKIAMDDPPPLSLKKSGIDLDLHTIVATCLEKDRLRRYRTAEALAADLRHFRLGEPIAARPASLIYRLSKRAAKHRGLIAGVLIALLAGTVGAWTWLRSLQEQALFEARTQQAENDRAAAEQAKRRAEMDAATALQDNVKLVQQTEMRWETVFHDDFEGTQLNTAWIPVRGHWQVTNRSLCGNMLYERQGKEGILLLQQPFRGDLQLTLTGLTTPEGYGELAFCLWTSREKPAYDGYFISLKPNELRIAKDNTNLYVTDQVRLPSNTVTRIKFERRAGRMCLEVGNQPPIEWFDRSPPNREAQQYFALYSFNSRFRISSLTINQAVPPERAGWLEMAQYQRAHGKPQAAIEMIDLFMPKLKNTSELEKALLQKAVCQEEMGQIEQAYRTFQTLYQNFPSDENWFQLADARLRSGEMPETVLTEAKTMHPLHVGWANLASTLLADLTKQAMHEPFEIAAIRRYLLLLEQCIPQIADIDLQHKTQAAISRQVFQLFWNRKTFTIIEMDELLKMASQINPNDPVPGLYRSYLHWGKNRARAIECMEAGIMADPDYGNGWYHLGDKLIWHPDYEPVHQAFNRLMKKYPDNFYSHHAFGLYLLNRKRYTEADAQFAIAIHLGTNHIEPYIDWSISLGAQKKWKEALEMARRAVALDPEHTRAILNLGNVMYFGNGDRAGGLAVVRQGCLATPENEERWDYLASLYEDLRIKEYGATWRDLAIADFKRGTELNPFSSKLFLELGMQQMFAGRSAEAIESFKQAGWLDQHSQHAAFWIGVCQLELKQYVETRELVDEALKVMPESALLLALSSVCLARDGQSEASVEKAAKAQRLAGDEKIKLLVDWMCADALVLRGERSKALEIFGALRARVKDPWIQTRLQDRIAGATVQEP